MKDKILLVAPSLGFESIFPLQLSTLASALKSAGYDCIGLDDRTHPGCVADAVRDISAAAGNVRPTAAVVEASPRNVNEAIRLAGLFNAATVPVIFVGPAAAIDATAMLDGSEAFACVTGDPETVVPALLAELAAAMDRPIAGARFRTQSGILVESPAVFDLDAANLVYDREVFPVSDYENHPRHPEFRQAAIETSRGCSFCCAFCPVPRRYAGTWRGRPVHAVVREMIDLRDRFGITDFVIEDDQPMHDLDRFQEFLKSVRRDIPGISMAFSNGLRADMLDDRTIKLMAAAGTRDLSLGIESGSAEVRKKLNRRVADEQIAHVIREAHRSRMLVTGYFMLGIPGESYRDMLETVLMANRLKFDYVHFMVYHPWQVTAGPASDLYSHVRTAAYVGSYINPKRLAGLTRRGQIKASSIASDAMRLIEWVMAGRTGGGTW